MAYALERTEFSMASTFKSSMDDSEVEVMKHFQQKNPSPSKYPIVEDHFKQALPTFQL